MKKMSRRHALRLAAAAAAAPAAMSVARAAAGSPPPAGRSAASRSVGSLPAWPVPSSWTVQPFDLDQVTVGDGLFRQKRDRILNFARNYPGTGGVLDGPDTLLVNFRAHAGLDTLGYESPDGWENPTSQLRGHFTGHFMTLLAQAYAGAGDQVFVTKLDYLVDALSKCQQALAAGGAYSHPGYLSAYPETQFIRLEQVSSDPPDVWAPWYTCHKIMRGLLDAHRLTGNTQALDVAEKMGDWAYGRLGSLPRQRLNIMWSIFSAGESGAMNEVMADLHALTSDPERKQRYLVAAQAFDNRQSLFDACLRNDDIITRLHANQHVPQFLGYLRIFEQTAETEYFRVAENFWDMVVPGRSYSHGGTGGRFPASEGIPANSNSEYFQPPNFIARSIAWQANTTNIVGGGAETCTTYNLLKLSRNLFFHDPDPKYMEYYERALLNHILGSISDLDSDTDPKVTYFLPGHPGAVRAYTGDPDRPGIGEWPPPFSCCGGTGLENHTKYQDSIYFRSADQSTLYVNLYIASTLRWDQRNLVISQETGYPREQASRLTVHGSGPLDIKLRVPSWVDQGYRVRINGVEQQVDAVPGSYLTVRRDWSPGDTIDVAMPFSHRIERTTDDPAIQSVFYGPLVLPVVGDRINIGTPRNPSYDFMDLSFYRHLKLDGKLTRAITPSGVDRFVTNDRILRPLYIGDGEAHHLYFRRHEPDIVFGSIVSGVSNEGSDEEGMTFLDRVWAPGSFADHGQFVRQVEQVSADWQRAGRFTRQERQAVLVAAARARAELKP